MFFLHHWRPVLFGGKYNRIRKRTLAFQAGFTIFPDL